MITRKIFIWIVVGLALLNIGQLIYGLIVNKDADEVKLEWQQKLKEEKQKVRDEAFEDLKKVTNDLFDTIQYFNGQNAKIKYIPYEKPIYVDRSLDTARAVMFRARRLLRSEKK